VIANSLYENFQFLKVWLVQFQKTNLMKGVKYDRSFYLSIIFSYMFCSLKEWRLLLSHQHFRFIFIVQLLWSILRSNAFISLTPRWREFYFTYFHCLLVLQSPPYLSQLLFLSLFKILFDNRLVAFFIPLRTSCALMSNLLLDSWLKSFLASTPFYSAEQLVQKRLKTLVACAYAARAQAKW